MPDYGHELEFGVFLPPAAEQFGETLQLAQAADVLGLELVSVQDHPYQSAFLDTWTLLTVLAAATSQVRVFPNVANLPLRPPAVLARSVAGLDIITGGRVELGLGAGGFADAIAAMGGPRRTPAESVEALGEAVEVIRALWTPGRGVKFAGKHYSLNGARPGPFPVHPVGIWLGAYKRRMLQLTGRAADGWLPSSPYAPPEELAAMNQIIDDAAEEAGRSPADVRRLYNIGGSFTGNGFLRGPAKVWVEQLAELALTEGISGFVLMVDSGGEDNLRRFAEEVAPGVRELVDQERTTLSRAEEPSVRPVEPVVDRQEVLEAQDTARRVHASKALRDYIVALLRRTRADDRVELGASPRAGLMLLRAAKARALVHGRDHALPDDVQSLAEAVLAHRLMLAPEAAGVQRREIIADAITAVPAL